jgi:katanin p60 ATPase-containing subunit A1
MQMDGISSAAAQNEEGKEPIVMVLAATNFPWQIDEALRRRLEKRVYIPLPDAESRVQLLHLHMQSMKVAPDVTVDKLAQDLEGYSGADITNVCTSSF